MLPNAQHRPKVAPKDPKLTPVQGIFSSEGNGDVSVKAPQAQQLAATSPGLTASPFFRVASGEKRVGRRRCIAASPAARIKCIMFPCSLRTVDKKAGETTVLAFVEWVARRAGRLRALARGEVER
jgi:hypothetical protein